MSDGSFASRLAEAMKNAGMRASQVASACGINKSTFSQYMSGRYAAKYDRIEAIASCLGCDARWLAGYDVSDHVSRSIPVVRSLAAEELFALSNTASREFAPPEYCSSEHFIFIVRDDSMSPMLPPGDMLICHVSDAVSSGDIGLFLLDGKRELVRRYFGENGNTKLVCGNPDWLPIHISKDESSRLRIIGRVVLSARRWYAEA